MNNLQSLTDSGVSIWLDYLSKGFIENNSLKEYIGTKNVVGVTTNPSIFQASITNDTAYNAKAEELLNQKDYSVDELLFDLIIDDVKNACDDFAEIYKKSNGYDGRVSIEVSPDLANDFPQSLKQAKELWEKINRPNLMIKIPATEAGYSTIEALISEGISVNATLIFSEEQYRSVANAYISGLDLANKNNLELSNIHSVASVFVSRIDTAVDEKLEKIENKQDFLSKAALYNALNVFDDFTEIFESDKFRDLKKLGANIQRPLWASTGVKDPNLPKNYYATNLALKNTVNTLPKDTIDFLYKNDTLDTIGSITKADRDNLFAFFEENDIDFKNTLDFLKEDGIIKFVNSWNELKDVLKVKFFDGK